MRQLDKGGGGAADQSVDLISDVRKLLSCFLPRLSRSNGRRYFEPRPSLSSSRRLLWLGQ